MPEVEIIQIHVHENSLCTTYRVHPEGENALATSGFCKIHFPPESIKVRNNTPRQVLAELRLIHPTLGLIYEWSSYVPAGGELGNHDDIYLDMPPNDLTLKVTAGYYVGTTFYQTDSKQFTIYLAYVLEIISSLGGATDPPAGFKYPIKAQSTATVTAIPAQGYTFSHWLLDGIVATDNPITITMDTNHTLQPIFVEAPPPTKYTLTITIYDPTMGTTDSNFPPGTYTLDEGTTVTVTAIPYEGFRFSRWLLNGETRTQNPISLTINRDYTLTAFFEPIPTYKLTINVNDPTMGTTDDNYPPGEYTVPEGKTITVHALPNPGFRFIRWLIEKNGATSESTANPYTITAINANYKLTAIFEQIPPIETATVTGLVRGILSRPVQGARVTIADKTTTTDANGKYVITGLRPGFIYIINVEHWLYAKSSLAITITEPKEYAVNFQLDVKPIITVGSMTVAATVLGTILAIAIKTK